MTYSKNGCTNQINFVIYVNRQIPHTTTQYIFLQNEGIFEQLHQLDELDKVTHAPTQKILKYYG